ncbi:MAG: hypothetical protein HWN66_06675 [Candidatus Helarchaeota archaeon]|nr:hypothetical protein [Candidatus Helarchaeota archaeon]
MLEKLRTSPSKKKLTLITLVTLVIFITLTIIFRFYEAALKESGFGIVEFEFAFTQSTATAILSAWGVSLIPVALQSVYLDFIYIAAYSIGLFGITIFIIRALQERWHNFGIIFAITPLIAGAFDIIENINLITMLNDVKDYPSFAPPIASICAFIKFGFLLVSIGFVLIAGIIVLIQKRRS